MLFLSKYKMGHQNSKYHRKTYKYIAKGYVDKLFEPIPAYQALSDLIVDPIYCDVLFEFESDKDLSGQKLWVADIEGCGRKLGFYSRTLEDLSGQVCSFIRHFLNFQTAVDDTIKNIYGPEIGARDVIDSISNTIINDDLKSGYIIVGKPPLDIFVNVAQVIVNSN